MAGLWLWFPWGGVTKKRRSGRREKGGARTNCCMVFAGRQRQGFRGFQRFKMSDEGRVQQPGEVFMHRATIVPDTFPGTE